MIVAAAVGDATSLMISLDGLKFTHAMFPADALDEYGFTVLDSSYSSLTIDTLMKTSSGQLPTHGIWDFLT
jgi:hypothetical protein